MPELRPRRILRKARRSFSRRCDAYDPFSSQSAVARSLTPARGYVSACTTAARVESRGPSRRFILEVCRFQLSPLGAPLSRISRDSYKAVGDAFPVANCRSAKTLLGSRLTHRGIKTQRVYFKVFLCPEIWDKSVRLTDDTDFVTFDVTRRIVAPQPLRSELSFSFPKAS